MKDSDELRRRDPELDVSGGFRLRHVAELQHLLSESLSEALPMGARQYLLDNANPSDADNTTQPLHEE